MTLRFELINDYPLGALRLTSLLQRASIGASENGEKSREGRRGFMPINGNGWLPITKNIAQLLPKKVNRAFTEVEAFISYSIDHFEGDIRSMYAYEKQWGWDHSKTRRFIKKITSDESLKVLKNVPESVETVEKSSEPKVNLSVNLKQNESEPTPVNESSGLEDTTNLCKNESEPIGEPKVNHSYIDLRINNILNTVPTQSANADVLSLSEDKNPVQEIPKKATPKKPRKIKTFYDVFSPEFQIAEDYSKHLTQHHPNALTPCRGKLNGEKLNALQGWCKSIHKIISTLGGDFEKARDVLRISARERGKDMRGERFLFSCASPEAMFERDRISKALDALEKEKNGVAEYGIPKKDAVDLWFEEQEKIQQQPKDVTPKEFYEHRS